ncbi:hypothetical protein FisN_27Lh071 [Fistulifera solaris]|uniref:Cation/H+ exchanger transmembrane domain-containing protein n=1 Tax=Fistulifera solaris TaxID=1519565 RepID=A0A1Z5JQS1_FISSO|nr:hypothetical protein FisN_27Lh071 [Fistulifera solaris]|eukprot:GAX16357.1 hypothetical protein FisN_27Lh071 [Fistulifera solaris]
MKILSLLAVLFFAVSPVALGSPLSEDIHSNVSTYQFSASYDMLTPQSGRKLQTEPDDTFAGEDMVVMVSFEDIYKVILFMAVAWLLGSLSAFAGLPSLVGEIVAGFLLGPPLADFVPYPGALVLLGNIGLIGLLLESGISLDLPQLKINGHRALLMATAGAVIPLAVGFSVGRWIGQDVPSAIAAGACFASTSLGVASNALNTGDVINTPLGQLIVTSSVLDDVYGLIMLSLLQVIGDPDSQAFDYVLPFLSSFGCLFVLGALGLTIFPRIIEEKILPMAPEGVRDQAAMVLLLLFVTAYMLLLNESKASYLTGVFLAGLTFCKIRSVHAFFVNYARPIHVWLLRVFFSATIGFQVPITQFHESYVLKWGFAFLFATFAKVPIGLMVPRNKKREIPTDFPYNPYFRDVIVTSLSMACRGEFNVIVAAYALSEGLFVPEIYSAVMFAIMFGCIIAPLVLTRVLKYYNKLSAGYLKGKHRIERIGNTDDGYRPLFLAIQSRTPVHWNLHESFQNVLEEMGLVIIDHRSWHTLDRTEQSAVDITELFVQDTKMKVRIKHCFGKSTDSDRLENGTSVRSVQSGGVADELKTETSSIEGLGEERDIEVRCVQIKDALSQIFKEYSPDDYAIQVSQWMAFVVDSTGINSERNVSNRDRFYSFQVNQAFDENSGEGAGDLTIDAKNAQVGSTATSKNPRQPTLRRSSTVGSNGAQHALENRPALTANDLWEFDDGCFNAAMEGDFLVPVCDGTGDRKLVEGLRQSIGGDTPRQHRRSVTFDASQLVVEEIDREKEVFNERLHGYVRQTSLQSPLPGA